MDRCRLDTTVCCRETMAARAPCSTISSVCRTARWIRKSSCCVSMAWTAQPRALVVHYAAHSVVLGPTNCKYSADYPGVMQTTVTKAVPGAQVMFVQGGAGDINPLFHGRSGDRREGLRVVQQMGELLAEEVVRVNGRGTPVPSGPEGIDWRSEVITFKDRWDNDGDDGGRHDHRAHQRIDRHRRGARRADTSAAADLEGARRGARAAVLRLHVQRRRDVGRVHSRPADRRRTAATAPTPARESRLAPGERIMERHLINLYDMQKKWLPQPGRP